MGNKSYDNSSEYNSSKTFNIKKASLKNETTGLFNEEKLFEHYESIYYFKPLDTNIYGYRLNSDPEERNYYLNCTKCGKLNLDTGTSNEIKYIIEILRRCKFCLTIFDTFSSPDNIITKYNFEKNKFPLSFDKITTFIKK